ncbi:hypothetical protein [Kaarinaea lacus]
MGKKIQITVLAMVVVIVTACANSDDKWSKDKSDKAADNSTSWQKDNSATDVDATKKSSSSSYWSEKSGY